MNIIDAIADPQLFAPYFGGNASTWGNWLVALRAVYGLKIPPGPGRKLVHECTGRQARLLPCDGFREVLVLAGRRSGKSRIAGVVAAFEGVLGGHESKLAPGERGLVAVVAPTRSQAGIVCAYIKAALGSPLLAAEVVGTTKDSFELRNGITVAVLTGDPKTVRGYTLVACVIDEVCFFGLDDEAKVRSDTELIRSIRPALATTRGRLVCISTKYAPRGWAYSTWKKHHGNDAAPVLVWDSPSRLMNPLLDQRIIDEALAEDPAAARSEYLSAWREDVAEFLPRSLIEGLVVQGRRELLPRSAVAYHAFADVSGGRQDPAALAIGHMQDGKCIIDLLKQYRPPHSPAEVIDSMASELQRYRVTRVCGDRYAGQFTTDAFRHAGVVYLPSPKSKSDLYLELLPRLCSGGIELLDDQVMVAQLAGLERRTRSGGKDTIDHARGGHDDLANATAGLAFVATKRLIRVGAFGKERCSVGY